MEPVPPSLFWCERGPLPIQVSPPGQDKTYVLINSTAGPAYAGNNTGYTLAPDNNESVTIAGTVTPNKLLELSQRIDEVLTGSILAAICIFGICGNLLNLVVLSRKAMIKGMERMEKSAHMGLIALAFSDMCFCITALPSCFIRHVYLTRKIFNTFYYIYQEGLINTFVLSSTWLTVTMAVSRYVAICHPLKARLLIGITFARGTVVVVYVFSVLFNVPRFLEKAPRSIQCAEGYELYYWSQGPLSPRIRPTWKLIYQWLYFLFGILLPLLSLIFCNARLIQALRRSGKMTTAGSKHNRSSGKSMNQTRRITLTLIIIVVMYLILVSPVEVNSFLRQMAINDQGFFYQYNIAVSVLNTLQSINFAFNFILYCSINTYFRRTVKDLFCRWTCMRRRRLNRFRSINNSSMKTSPLYSARHSHACTYLSEMSTAI